MDWYELRPEEPHSIENQIHQMFFADLTYRSVVATRSSDARCETSSGCHPTLTFLLDTGYVVSQVLAILRLLDNRPDVISVARLLADVKSQRKLFTRENYVAGDGKPYDYDACVRSALGTSREVEIFGIQAPGLSHALIAKQRHETFDLLCGRTVKRSRGDLIGCSIFDRMAGWLQGVSARNLRQVRNKFLAHAADERSRQSLRYEGVQLAEIDEAQKAIVRVERAIVDVILAYEVYRDVIPLPPLGMFNGLEKSYTSPGGPQVMYTRWQELDRERNGWSHGIVRSLTAHD